MSRVWILIGVAALLVVVGVVATKALAGEHVTSFPTEIEAAITAKYPGAQVLERERSRRKYEAELKTADGRRIEVSLSTTGTVLEEESKEDEDDEDDDGRSHEKR